MAVTSFPYTSVGGDRTITAFQEASGFNLFVSSGVVEATAGDLSTKLQVSAVPDTMQVSVAAGDAVIIGHRYMQTAAETLTLTAGGSNDRIDVIAVESNRENATRAAQLVVVEGTEAAEPVAPTLTTTDTVYQVALAWVTVPGSATSLNAATITDKRVASRPRGLSTEAQAIVNQFGYKLPVAAASTGNLTLSGEQTIDGVSVVAGDRVLVKDQTDKEYNGIYVASANAWTRASDFDADADVIPGSLVHVEGGTINGARLYKLTTASPITLGTTELSFEYLDVGMPEYVYQALGVGDGAAISAAVNNLLDATGDWSGTTALTMKLTITGDLGLPATPAYGAGIQANPYRHFEFTSTQTRGARVIIDWSGARGLEWTDTSMSDTYVTMINQTGVGARISHHGLALSIAATGGGMDIYGVEVTDGAEATFTDCYIHTSSPNTSVGIRVAELDDLAVIDKCEIVAESDAGDASSITAIFTDRVKLRVTNSRIKAITTPAGNLTANNITYGVYAYQQSVVTLEDCDIYAKTAGANASYPGIAYALYNAGTSAMLQARNCRVRAYTNSNTYGIAYAVRDSGTPSADNVVQLVGCTFPTVAISGLVQTGAVYFNDAASETKYCLIGNLFSGANSSPNIVLTQGSATDDYYVAANIFNLNLY
jgi:hypothetical protein